MTAVCEPGYGGASADACTDCAEKTPPGYGPEFRSSTECINCPTQTVGFSFFYKETLVPYQSPPVVRSAATSPADCVSQFAQIESGLWYLAGASNTATGTTVKLSACLESCRTSGTACMFATFEYKGDAGANPDGDCFLATTANTETTQ